MGMPCSVPFSPAQQALWERLSHCSLAQTAATQRFHEKLARENGWSPRFAARVEGEYRRFLLLALEAGHGVCPSPAVDQAWHQHLLDTRHYWEKFCPEVLGSPLHHCPSQGGAAERQRLEAWYRQTLASYERVFGDDPPLDVWPRAGQPRAARRRWALPALPLAALALGGCTVSPGPWPFPQLAGPEFLLFYLLLILLGLPLALALRRQPTRSGATRAGEPEAGWADLDPIGLAYLAGGTARVAETALVRLKTRGDGHKGTGLADPIERDVSLAVTAKRFHPRTWEARDAGWASLQRLQSLQQHLEERGLLLRDPQRHQARRAPLLVLAPLLGLGLLRLIHGALAGRPIGFLLLLCFALVGACVLVVNHPPRRTARGEQLLRRVRRGVAVRTLASGQEEALAGVAVLGLGTLQPAAAGGAAPVVRASDCWQAGLGSRISRGGKPPGSAPWWCTHGGNPLRRRSRCRSPGRAPCSRSGGRLRRFAGRPKCFGSWPHRR
jgi:uncharacterized protein (TIGR04222 family)